jgi:hypothetical protein
VLYERRRDFPTAGVPWKGGGEPAARKRAERALAALREARLVTIYCNNAGRTTSVKLTEQADVIARALADLDNLDLAVDGLVEMVFYDLSGKRWVAETCFTQGQGWGDGKQQLLVAVEHALLPAMVRGWLTSNATASGQVAYRFTPRGWDFIFEYMADAAAVKAGRDDFAALSNLPKPVKGGCRLYFDELRLAMDSLSNAKPNQPQELGLIPIRSGCWVSYEPPQPNEKPK